MDQLKFLSPEWASILMLLLLFLGAWVCVQICRMYIIRLVRTLTKDVSSFWGQIFFYPRIFSQISWLLPVLLIHLGTPQIPGLPPLIALIIERVSVATLVVLCLRVITIFMGRVNDIYSSLPVSRNRPIKGIIQVVLIVLHLLAAILVFSSIMDRSPLVFLSGLGAMTAVLLLVFRDTILSLVAGVQLTSNDLIRVGDWLEMPQFNADGFVIDIALYAVRVQNWDKTYTMIPTHKFMEHSFKNWRGMQESGGRRIKRAVNIDMSSVRFLTEEEIEKFSRFALLKDYIAQKKQELAEYNQQFASDPQLKVNGRRMTNVGTFRAYLIQYLKKHPMIHQDLTFLVRQLAPNAEGLPMEIYVFVNDVRWAIYESAQADIFDHVLAIIPEFGLRVYQSPSGHDFRPFVSQAMHQQPESLTE